MSSDDRLVKLATSAAERVSTREREFVESAAGSRSKLFVGYEEHAAFVSDALAIPIEIARAYCQGQLAAIEDEAISADEVEGMSFRRVTRIAMGESPQPVDPMARALRRLERALASRQEVVNVATSPISITLPEQHIAVTVAAAPAKQADRPWPTETRIKKRDEKGRADVFETRPLE